MEKKDIEKYYQLSKKYFDNEEISKAIETLKIIETTESETTLWNYRMGFTNFYNENYKEALKYFFKVLEIEPTYQGLNTFLFWLYLELANDEANDEKDNYLLAFKYANNALKYAKLALEIDKDENILDDFVEIYQKLAWLCERLNNYEMALEYLNLSLEIEKESEWAFSEMGHCLRKLEKYDEALFYFQKVLSLGRKDTWIYSEIAWTYYLKKEYETALEYMKKAKEFSPLQKDEFLEKRISMILKEIEK